jgi:phenylacetate-CoA ligase
MNQFLGRQYERWIGQGLLPFYETGLRGRSTFRYRDEFEANQWRSPEEIAALQWEKLPALLKHAYQTVPYYRSLFDEAGLRPEAISTPADFARLPILEKATVRAQRDQLISSAIDRRKLVASATGGSTGEPMRFYYDRNSYERRVAAAMRGDGWAGWRLCAGEFYIWGVSLLPESGFGRRKKQLHHASQRRAVVNSFDLSAERIAALVAQYNRQRPRVVVGYANAIYEFARCARQAGLSLRPPAGVISSAEKLFQYQRTMIEEAFGVPVFDRYGCREVMMIAAECEQHSGLHATADNVYVEIVRNGQLCEPGESGEVLLTDLHNYGMPLIRYKVGDVGSWKGHDCACRRGLPLLNVVEGRTLDLISTPSGRVISGEFFPHLLKDFAWVRQYQVVQEQRDQLTVRITADEPLPSDNCLLLKETMIRTLGPEMHVSWEIGKDVVIEQGRKFRPVLSRVPVSFGGADGEES